MTKTFTVLNVKQNLDKVAPIGTILNLKKDKDTTFDENSIRVYLESDGSEVGFVGANYLAEGTEKNDVLADMMAKAGKTDGYLCRVIRYENVKMGANNKLDRTTLVIESLEEAEEENLNQQNSAANGGEKFQFSVKGSIRTYRAKKDVISGLIKGEEPLVGIKMQGDLIIATYNGEPAGEIDPKSGDYDLAVKVVTVLGEVTAKTSNPLNSTYNVDFAIDEESMMYVKTGKKVLTLQDVKEEKSSFIPMERLDAIQTYLENAGLKSKQIMKVMETYREYPTDISGRIPEPKVLFDDNFGAVRKTIIYLNKGKHLRLEGEKGTGKNVLTAVLAYIYQRPLYELSMNSQTDKMDLLGSKTFTTEVDENGKETTQIGFQKEALVEAMEVGGFMNLDEVNTADPSVLVMLHSIVDDRGSLEVPGYGRVKADDNFGMILTMNKEYIGTNSLNEATRDRFTPIIFPNNNSIASMLNARVKGAKAQDIHQADSVYKSIMTMVQDGTLSMDCITVRGFIDAVEVADELGLKEALEDNVANRVEDVEYRETVLNIIDDILG